MSWKQNHLLFKCIFWKTVHCFLLSCSDNFLPRSGAPLILEYKKKSLWAIGKNFGFAARTYITIDLPTVVLWMMFNKLLFSLFWDECPPSLRFVQWHSLMLLIHGGSFSVCKMWNLNAITVTRGAPSHESQKVLAKIHVKLSCRERNGVHGVSIIARAETLLCTTALWDDIFKSIQRFMTF